MPTKIIRIKKKKKTKKKKNKKQIKDSHQTGTESNSVMPTLNLFIKSLIVVNPEPGRGSNSTTTKE